MNALMVADNLYFLISWVLNNSAEVPPIGNFCLVLLEGLTGLGMDRDKFNFKF